ncbi:hypothetical protein QBC47DRAFT_60338 [Echria macrotheca]|uniref:Uncharacterized protein n=1 Tax=Echria macrotheca TaxID=438768 RepID=A0AAJ0F6N0_9PEZI|nr:hypothetical protein QBC47DRAFT_60338 [Echria macrotheca]
MPRRGLALRLQCDMLVSLTAVSEPLSWPVPDVRVSFASRTVAAEAPKITSVSRILACDISLCALAAQQAIGNSIRECDIRRGWNCVGAFSPSLQQGSIVRTRVAPVDFDSSELPGLVVRQPSSITPRYEDNCFGSGLCHPVRYNTTRLDSKNTRQLLLYRVGCALLFRSPLFSDSRQTRGKRPLYFRARPAVRGYHAAAVVDATVMVLSAER